MQAVGDDQEINHWWPKFILQDLLSARSIFATFSQHFHTAVKPKDGPIHSVYQNIQNSTKKYNNFSKK